MSWNARDLLTAWESAVSLRPVERAVAFLTADGATDPGTAWDMPVDLAGALLARHLAAVAGPTVEVIADCPRCASLLEASVPVPRYECVGAAAATVAGWTVRVPTLADVASVTGRADAADALRALCLAPGDAEDGPPDPPDDAAVDAMMDELAGAAALHSRVACADCGSDFEVEFDVCALLWDRIAAEAPALLGDVATLASAFGWSEQAILDLPPARREYYLTCAGAR